MYILATTETLSQYNDLEVEIYFTLLEDCTYTTNLEKAFKFETNIEAEKMKRLGHFDNFTVTEIPHFKPGEK